MIYSDMLYNYKENNCCFKMKTKWINNRFDMECFKIFLFVI